MSYRTVKRLLGETSLERKCRFLFGGGLMLLISGSFYFYARLNAQILYEQNRTTAKLLIAPVLLAKHWKWEQSEDYGDFAEYIEKMAHSFRPEELREYSWAILRADPTKAEAEYRPIDEVGYEALEQLRQGRSEYIRILRDKGEYRYYGAVFASASCVKCHNLRIPDSHIAEGDLIGAVKITFPLERTEQALARNNAILLATAIVTAFLAMLAAYAIVRYVIVKPVLHLKDVSDAIARGNMDLRADIRTGDEFEELSHAFNRMLRHLVTVQDELRQVNKDLDAKVDELAQVNLSLYEMNKLKDEFLATISHELKTPLNSILGFSDLLATSDNLNERQKRYVENIQTSGKHLLAMISDLLDLAKLEAGKMRPQVVELDVADLVEPLAASMMPMARRKNIDLSVEVEPNLPTVLQDPRKLKQILYNLLSNAIKFTPEGGRIRVRAERAGTDQLALVVEDTGIGIPLEEQSTIFEKFRQGRIVPGQKDALTREFEGTGLGLSIVKELARLLGGEVRLESEFGKGSTFTVLVPMVLDVGALQPEDSSAELISSLNLPRPPEFRQKQEDVPTAETPHAG